MMTTPSIPNPPNAPDGYVANWNGSAWVIIPIGENIIPAYPANLPAGYTAVWDGSEWDIIAPPPSPPAPTPDQITATTINTAVSNLQVVAYLTTAEMAQHITPESRQEVTDYIHAVANIIAQAQVKYAAGEAYTPEFPPQPVVVRQQLTGAPVIRFVAGE